MLKIIGIDHGIANSTPMAGGEPPSQSSSPCGRTSGMRFLLLAAVIFSAPTLANTPLQDTAVVALKAAHDSDTGTTVEHGGMLIRNGDEIHYLEPRQGHETGVRVIDRDMLKPGDLFMGTYHTHLCMSGYYHQFFSTQDVVVAVLTGLPEFMLDECTGEVHEFNAKIDNLHDTAIVGHLFGADCEKVDKYLPAGYIVGNIGVVEKLRTAAQQDTCKPRSAAEAAPLQLATGAKAPAVESR